MRAFRIADRRWPIFDGSGAALHGGRWNSPGRRVIYASASFACAMLERLAQTGTGHIPKNQVSVVIDIPDDLSGEDLTFEHGLASPSLSESRALGHGWLVALRSVVLTVPSVVARHDRNVLINPEHPDFARIVCSNPEPVVWDERLFSRSEG